MQFGRWTHRRRYVLRAFCFICFASLDPAKILLQYNWVFSKKQLAKTRPAAAGRCARGAFSLWALFLGGERHGILELGSALFWHALLHCA